MKNKGLLVFMSIIFLALVIGSCAGGGGGKPVLVNAITVAGADGGTTVAIGETLQMIAQVQPENATNKTVTWSVENADATSLRGNRAEITQDGVLTGLAAGTVVVKASAQDGSEVEGTREITVTAQPMFTITAQSDPAEGGEVRINTGNWGSHQSVTVSGGTQVTLVAEENTGYAWEGWYDGADKESTLKEYVVTVTANKTYTARFRATDTIIISGPGGIEFEIPPDQSGQDISVELEPHSADDILGPGEQAASTAVRINLGNETFLQGALDENRDYPLYELRFPVTLTDADPQSLYMKVKVSDGSVLPISERYDPESGTYIVTTFGLKHDWVMGIVAGDPVTTVQSESRSIDKTVRSSPWDWPSRDAVIYYCGTVQTRILGPTAVQSQLLPIIQDVFIKLQAAGFISPNLVRNNDNKYVVLLTNNSNTRGDTTSHYSVWESPNVDKGLLGRLFIYYDHDNLLNRLNPNDTTKWNMKGFRTVIAHEIFHAVQEGYGFKYINVNSQYAEGRTVSSTIYDEGTANLIGGTYAEHQRVDGSNLATVTDPEPDRRHNLGESLDDVDKDPYRREDFFAFMAKRYFNGCLKHLNDLYSSFFVHTTAFTSEPDAAWLKQRYREALDTFLWPDHTLSSLYTEYALQRLYLHERKYLLTEHERNNFDGKTGDFRENHLAWESLLTEGTTYFSWKSKKTDDFDYDPLRFSNIKSLSSVAATIEIPSDLPDYIETIPINVEMSNGDVNKTDDEEGIRIMIFPEINSEPVSSNAFVVARSLDNPIEVPIRDGDEKVTHLVVIIINAYVEDLTVSSLEITISQEETEAPFRNTTRNTWHPTFEEAELQAREGDEILVYPGTYTEAFHISKSLSVRSAFGPEATIIDGEKSGHVVRIAPRWGATGSIGQVELSGFTIQNAGDTNNGISAMNVSSLIVHGNILANNVTGVSAENLSSITIEDNRFPDETGTAILLRNIEDLIEIRNNQIEDSYVAIRITNPVQNDPRNEEGLQAHIIGNRITAGLDAIIIYSERLHLTMAENTIQEVRSAFIIYGYPTGTIQNNLFTGTEEGLSTSFVIIDTINFTYTDLSRSLTIDNNSFSGDSKTTSLMHESIRIYVCGELRFTNNHVFDNQSHISINCRSNAEPSRVWITGNTIERNNRHGLFLTGGRYEISGNTIHDNKGRGLILSNVQGSTATNNEISSNLQGGIAVNSGQVTISNNRITDNTAVATAHYPHYGSGGGVLIMDAADVELTGNTIHRNHATARGGGVFGNPSNWVLEEEVIVNDQPRTVPRHAPPFEETTNNYSGNTHDNPFGAWGPGEQNYHTNAGFDVTLRGF